MKKSSMQIPVSVVARVRQPRLACAVWIAAITLSPLRAVADSDPSSAPLEPTKAAAKAAYEKQVVCSYRTPIGSRIARKSCTTRAQADAETANVKERMREMSQAADRNAQMSPGSQPIR